MKKCFVGMLDRLWYARCEAGGFGSQWQAGADRKGSFRTGPATVERERHGVELAGGSPGWVGDPRSTSTLESFYGFTVPDDRVRGPGVKESARILKPIRRTRPKGGDPPEGTGKAANLATPRK